MGLNTVKKKLGHINDLKGAVNIHNADELKDTMAILDKGNYLVNGKRKTLKLSPKEMQQIQVYQPEDIKNISENADLQHIKGTEEVAVDCENMDSYSLAIKRYQDFPALFNENSKPILVLNLANAVRPGGGVRAGSTTQEEELCRRSSLLLSLESSKASAYYEYNKSLHTRMGSDAVMITPKVEIIKDENRNLLEDSVIVSVMTCAAPDLRHGMEGMSQKAYQNMLYGRITGMLKVAAHLGYEVLVLGAFGCGAFKNDARVVSDLFYKALKEFNYNGMTAQALFRRIDFAILCNPANPYNFNEFARNFGTLCRDKDAKETSVALERGYTFFWKDDEEKGEFSNWYRREFVIDDFRYFCVEQYMMAQKAKLFHDSECYTKILRANNPWECKELGKQVAPFDENAWNAVKFDVVKTGNRAKFVQNSDLMKLLLSTGDSIMAEASPRDTIWGIGLDAVTAKQKDLAEWPGQNLSGKVLMELREEFRTSKP